MDILYKEFPYQIVGAALDVHNQLGCGFMEKVYQEAFAITLQERDIPFEREKPVSVFFHEKKLSCPYICDFMVDNKIIVELKAVQKMEEIHKAQLINYLHMTGLQLGILINFNDTSLNPVRLINYKSHAIIT